MIREGTIWSFVTAVREALGAGAYSEYEELKAEQLADYYEDKEYHDLHHIKYLVDGLERFEIPGRERALMVVAAWFHDRSSVSDSIYRAETFMQERGFDDKDILFVHNMILATDRDAVPHEDEYIALRQGQFRDSDWRVLGLPPAAYNRYASLIEVEYSDVPCDVFRDGRLEFLRTIVDREPMFWTPEMEEQYGDQARENAAREIRWRSRDE